MAWHRTSSGRLSDPNGCLQLFHRRSFEHLSNDERRTVHSSRSIASATFDEDVQLRYPFDEALRLSIHSPMVESNTGEACSERSRSLRLRERESIGAGISHQCESVFFIRSPLLLSSSLSIRVNHSLPFEHRRTASICNQVCLSQFIDEYLSLQRARELAWIVFLSGIESVSLVFNDQHSHVDVDLFPAVEYLFPLRYLLGSIVFLDEEDLHDQSDLGLSLVDVFHLRFHGTDWFASTDVGISLHTLVARLEDAHVSSQWFLRLFDHVQMDSLSDDHTDPRYHWTVFSMVSDRALRTNDRSGA